MESRAMALWHGARQPKYWAVPVKCGEEGGMEANLKGMDWIQRVMPSE